MSKSKEDIKLLKENWIKDPCWDIEDTEGFEQYHCTLLAYRRICEAEWLAQAEKHHNELASKICPMINACCHVEKCAWWNEVAGCCGTVQSEQHTA